MVYFEEEVQLGSIRRSLDKMIIIYTHISYANLIWGQNLNAVRKIVILQKKALRIMNFQ